MSTALTAWSGTSCPRCGGAMEDLSSNSLDPRLCPHCQTSFIAWLFPASTQNEIQGRCGERLQEESEAACFHHVDKRAETACGMCGRFLCALCAIDTGDKQYCPQCLENGIRSGALPEFQATYFRHDVLALATACIPLMLAIPVLLIVLPWATDIALGFALGLLLFPSFVTAPASLYLALRFRKTVTRPLGRPAAWFPLTVLLAAAQMAVWAAAIIVFTGSLFSEF